ncbi:MAG: aldo/keto reductase [Ancalomicrobiaceae bacterium]|nr:aldo/keto reductase [Ancalomicrobiaceae bacterium]
MSPRLPDRIRLTEDLEISRVVTGLWQVADMERGGTPLDREKASSDLMDYARVGLDSFDMADHYGSAELIAGRLLERVRSGEAAGSNRPTVFTKWCPPPGPMTAEVVRAGVARSLDRLGIDCVDLMQFHWWTFEHLAWLDAMKGLAALQAEGRIKAIGVTNFDTDHLRVLVKHGIPVVTNQVSFSLIDRRAAEEMSAFCLATGVRLLAYGTLGGGLLSQQWLGRPEPGVGDIGDWSKMKYRRFVEAAGGWQVLQRLIAALDRVAAKYASTISNVATRWVLDHAAVAAVIVGARLGESEHRADTLKLFDLALDDDDRAELAEATGGLRRIPGDCGDEYRKPPFLTASGDLSHHLEQVPKVYAATPVDGRPDRFIVNSGSVWEPLCGFSRAVRVKDRIQVSGTTATNGAGEVVAPGDAAAQTVFILDKIAASLAALGGSLKDVVRTRIFLADVDDWEAVSRVHGRVFAGVLPANSLLEVGRLVGDYRVEIEAEAELG